MRTKISFLSFLFITVLLHAQNNFIPGSITTMDGTTRNGEINFQDWKRSPKQIEFRIGDENIIYTPDLLQEFTVNQETYISRYTSLDVTEQNLDKMHADTPVEFMDVHIFMKQIVSGTINLYEYFDSRSHYFVEKGDDFRELNYRQMLTKDSKLRPQKNFIGQLNLLFSDCKSLKVSNSLDYKRDDLIEVVEKYNHCGETEYTYQKQNKVKSNYGVFAGVGLTKLKFERTSGVFEGFEPEYAVSYTVGGFYELFINNSLEKWSVLGELGYFSVQDSYEYSFVYSPALDYKSHQNLEFDLSTIYLNLIVRYRFNTNNQKIVPFLEAGPSFNYALSGSLEVDQRKDNVEVENHYVFDARDVIYGLQLGVGVDISQFNFGIRYIANTKVLNFADRTGLNTFNARVSYSFN
ncbi:porin family protein [Mangrovimonas sp. ST2L15]|uniref:porin family protein n=1 Tax=Mangrovimonas sp. ST2L15 TaxID=1645916 RepID=UPI0006B58069|nr:porin family protein [Mangrovimonas sp. ST2L15]